MSLVTPDIGLLFWTTISFLLLVFVLGKFAWKPMLKAINERQNSIEESLKQAEKARAEMANLQTEHKNLLVEAKMERDQILKDAKETRDKVIADARNAAKTEAASVMAQAQAEIHRDQEQAFKMLKAEVADMAISAATAILKSELSDKAKQVALVDEYLKDAKFN